MEVTCFVGGSIFISLGPRLSSSVSSTASDEKLDESLGPRLHFYVHLCVSNIIHCLAFHSIRSTSEDIERVSYELCEDLARQNVVYAELRFSPFLPGQRQPVPGDRYVDGALRGLERGERDFGIKARAILAFMRAQPGVFSTLSCSFGLSISSPAFLPSSLQSSPLLLIPPTLSPSQKTVWTSSS